MVIDRQGRQVTISTILRNINLLTLWNANATSHSWIHCSTHAHGIKSTRAPQKERGGGGSLVGTLLYDQPVPNHNEKKKQARTRYGLTEYTQKYTKYAWYTSRIIQYKPPNIFPVGVPKPSLRNPPPVAFGIFPGAFFEPLGV